MLKLIKKRGLQKRLTYMGHWVSRLSFLNFQPFDWQICFQFLKIFQICFDFKPSQVTCAEGSDLQKPTWIMTDLVGSECLVVTLSEEVKNRLRENQDKYYKKTPIPGKPGKFRVQGTKALGGTAKWPLAFCQEIFSLWANQKWAAKRAAQKVMPSHVLFEVEKCCWGMCRFAGFHGSMMELLDRKVAILLVCCYGSPFQTLQDTALHRWRTKGWSTTSTFKCSRHWTWLANPCNLMFIFGIAFWSETS